MLSIVNPRTPLLIIVNKQDLKDQNPFSASEAIREYKLFELVGMSFNVIECSAKYGDGVGIGLEWMIEKIEEKK